MDRAFRFAAVLPIGGALIPSKEEGHSAEAERDSIALLTAEGLARAAQDPPAQPAVKPDRSVVVRKRPDDKIR